MIDTSRTDWVTIQTDRGMVPVLAILNGPFAILPDGVRERRKGGWKFTFSVTHITSGLAVCPALSERQARKMIDELLADRDIYDVFSKVTAQEVRDASRDMLPRLGAILTKYRRAE